MLQSLLTKSTRLFGNENEKKLKRYNKIVAQINAFEAEMQRLEDSEFPQKTAAFKEKVLASTCFTLTERSLFRMESELSSDSVWKQLKSLKGKEFQSQEELLAEIEKRVVEEEAEEILFAARRQIQQDAKTVLDEILPEAFALVREASVRTLGERHYDVQLIGGIALHEGNIAEMQTGEGKTLASTCPAYLNSLTGQGVHIVTPNDYLAQRDSVWMGQIYHFLGTTVGLIQHDYHPTERQKNYRADITYGTNNEFGFDYLRDNMKMDLADYVQRDFHYAIIDEVDSILIDESRTPLIISGATDDNIEKYRIVNKLIYDLQREIQKIEVPQLPDHEAYGIDPEWEYKEDRDVVREGDYTLDEKSRHVALTDRGAGKIEKRLVAFEHYQLTDQDVQRLESEINEDTVLQGLKSTANYDFKRQDGFLQTLSDKIANGGDSLSLLIPFKSRILQLAYKGMLLPTYRLSQESLEHLQANPELGPVMTELTNLKDLEYESEEAFFEALQSTLGAEKADQFRSAIFAEIQVLKSLFDRVNTPVLHHINQALKAHLVFKRDVDYVVQNGQVVIVDDFTGRLMPGRRYSDGLHQALEAKEKVRVEMETQTLASITFQNYFRLYRKIAGMTGTAETEKDEFKKIYNLGVVVIPTHLPVIRNDKPDLIYKTQKSKFNAIVNQVQSLYERKQPVLVGTVSVETSELISRRLQQKGIEHRVLNAKYHAQEAEIIKNAGQSGSVTIATNMAGRGTDIKPAPEVLELGGVFILGTERHDSRRIDNQLRGRSGRQGDPGESQFFLAMEDNLLRIFGGEKLAKWMDRFQIEEDMPIEHMFVSRAIANAQKKVESMHFSARKSLLEYDDVMERQRNIIYDRRRAILSDDIHHCFLDMCAETIEELMDQYCSDKFQDQWKREEFKQDFFHIFNSHLNESWEDPSLKREEIVHKLFEITEDCYQIKLDRFKEDFFNKYKEIELFEVAGIYLQIILHENARSVTAATWKFPHPQMRQFRKFFEMWLQRFNEYCRNKRINSRMEAVTPFLNEIPDDFRQHFFAGFMQFKQEIFETLVLMVQRQNLLNSNDERWKNHLLAMDHLREEVGLAGYAQKKPIDEYRRKAFALFDNLISDIARESTTQFFHRNKLPHPRYLFFHVDPQAPEAIYSHGDEPKIVNNPKPAIRKKAYVSNRERKKQRAKRNKAYSV